MAEYIEREAALEAVNGWREQLIPTYGENDEYVKCLETVAEHLDAIHAADVRPVVRGKWVRSGEIMYCNNCKYIAFNPHKFCPNCGADMREGE